MIDNKRKAYICGLSAVLLWSTVASAFKLTLKYFSVIEMLLYSTAASTVCLFAVLILQGKWQKLKQCGKNDFFNSALLGLLNPFLYYIILFKAYSLLPAQQAQPLNFTWGVVLALLSIPLLKQKIRFRSILAVFISFFGVVIIAIEGNLAHLRFKNPFGVVLAVGSSFLWALYWILNTKDKRDPVVKLFMNFSFGLFYILITAFIYTPPPPNLSGLLGTIYIGFFEMGITFVLWLTALRLAPTTAHISILIYLAPFLSFLLIHTFVGEKILTSSVFGLILIIAGMIVQQLGKKSSNSEI